MGTTYYENFQEINTWKFATAQFYIFWLLSLFAYYIIIMTEDVEKESQW